MTEILTCSNCNQSFPQDQLTNFSEHLLCPDCLSSETTVCSRCGDPIWRSENAGDAATPLCQTCYDRFYTECENCGRAIALDDAYYDEDDSTQEEPLCWSCYNSHEQYRQIHEYSFKPDPIFYGKGERYFGVELEMDEGGESGENACQIMRRANRDRGVVYCKHDGSIHNGFEIVTHPMTLEYHYNGMPWSDLLHEAISLGYHSHKTTTCGLHIHVNRTAFGETESEQEPCIARVLYIVEKFWDELLKFSRRTPRQLEQWANRYGYKEQPLEILDHAKKGYGHGRYSCVNLSNYDTIEFRIFRGTLKYNTLIATLQLVNRICDVAINLSDKKLTALAWTTFVADIQEPELIQYLKERRLYVNEPVEDGGEL